jgi:hypothetical protein
MAYDSLQIAIAGTEAADIYPDLLSLGWNLTRNWPACSG